MTVLGDVLREMVRLLPATVARVLLLLTILGAGTAHYLSTRRIEALEKKQIEYETNYRAVMQASRDVIEELKLYRAAVIEENKTLRRSK